ncbi:YeeE/YedE family protein [Jannaschia seohaensis]|uniref:Sulfur transporter n=1 Tax=Jannaschia seohaensis TaxID=475081 RepID=A0A2Y9C2L1_9RHOB|nr:YeeE/YedE family protein [Jannaschia seohaensis]PWJ15063.1 sulfur transporter [Jannaschia seohaensis]SSA49912.1 Sulphur transport [Jannaschia seohaensis]
MDLIGIVDALGEPRAAALAGLFVGIVFGLSAERSGFCLRAAAVETARGSLGPRPAVWLLTFSTGVVWTQAMDATGFVDLGQSRWLASPGTLSGAVIGGLVFGVGMVLARGCPGRLLVLGATGNLRAILSGLVFAVVAQMSLHGALNPLRQAVSGFWVTDGTNPDLLLESGLGQRGGLLVGLAFAVLALIIARRARVSFSTLVFACGVGFAVALGWGLTAMLGRVSFEPVALGSLTFSGPSADVLMYLLAEGHGLDFDIGLVPGVALAAFLSAWAAGRLAWQGWDGAGAMRRYLAGAALMGFGAMTAGGCTIGAGVTGASTFALTAWAALTAMWVGGMAADRLIDGAAEGRAPLPSAGA